MEPVEIGFFAKLWEWIIGSPGFIWDGYVWIYGDFTAGSMLLVLISMGLSAFFSIVRSPVLAVLASPPLLPVFIWIIWSFGYWSYN